MNQFTAGIIFTIVAQLLVVAMISRPKVNKIKVNVNGRKARTITVRSYTRKAA